MEIESMVGCAFISVVGVMMLIAGFLAFTFTWNTTREGQHTGYVTAVEQDGLIFHNYRVYFKTDNSSSQEDVYCVNRDNKELAQKIKEANKSRKLVEIEFDGVRGFGLALCQDDEIQSVNVVE